MHREGCYTLLKILAPGALCAAVNASIWSLKCWELALLKPDRATSQRQFISIIDTLPTVQWWMPKNENIQRGAQTHYKLYVVELKLVVHPLVSFTTLLPLQGMRTGMRSFLLNNILLLHPCFLQKDEVSNYCCMCFCNRLTTKNQTFLVYQVAVKNL